MERVAIVAGARTPFVRAGKAYAGLGPLALAKPAVRGLIERHHVDAGRVDALAFGVVVPERGKPNLAREIVLEAGLRSATIIADAIARGRIQSGIAGGVEWLSGADPSTFKEPTTGLTMGEHMELTRREWKAARERHAGEIVAVAGVSQDTGPRPDTSMAALAALKPAFAADGTITAGNASPVTDGASAVLLMSESRARQEGREPLAFIEAMEYAALHPSEGLLMAPASGGGGGVGGGGVGLQDIDLIGMHEAFAAQVLANAL